MGRLNIKFQKLKIFVQKLRVITTAKNKLLGTFLIVSWFGGLFPITNPFPWPSAEKIKNFQFRWLHPALVIPLVSFFTRHVFAANLLNQILVNPLITTSSHYILFYFQIVSIQIVDTYIRFGAVIYCKKTIQLFRLLELFKINSILKPGKCSIWSDKNYICFGMVGFVFVVTIGQQSVWVGKFFDGVSGRTTSAVQQNQTGQQIIIAMNQFAISYGIHYCAMFMLFWAVQLISAHDQVYRDFVKMVNALTRLPQETTQFNVTQRPKRKDTGLAGSSSKSDNVPATNVISMELHKQIGSATISVNQVGVIAITVTDIISDLEKILDSLIQLKIAFQLYSQIASTYSLAILIYGMSRFFNSTGLLLYQHRWFDEWELILLTYLGLYFIICSVSIGSWMEHKMEENRESVRMVIGRSGIYNNGLLCLGDIFSGWEWSLSAGGLCNVNRGLIFELMGVIMTYLIFMFQLKISETG